MLDPEQVAREGDALLQDFPILRVYLQIMAEPVLGPGVAEEAGLGAALCGKPLVSLLLGGPQGDGAQAAALEAFQQALVSRDLGRALSLLELYGRGGDQEGALRDRLLACAALGGEALVAAAVNMSKNTPASGESHPGCCWDCVKEIKTTIIDKLLTPQVTNAKKILIINENTSLIKY